MNAIADIFAHPDLNKPLLQELEKVPDPRSRYLIAITPRSGSTYLCDAIKNTKRMGRPQELLSANAIANRITKNMPGRTPEEYLRNGLRVTKSTQHDVSGLKASWFQFELFLQALGDPGYLQGFKYIYLTRHDLAAQAVSLYKATSSDIFHSHIQHTDEALAKLEALEYDYEAIKYWYDHIVVQEEGWRRYFSGQGISPYCISYEELEADIGSVLKAIAEIVSVDPQSIRLPEQVSELKKLRDGRSSQWTQRFQTELALHV
ncbi:MAG: hypothetical protein CTY16_08005 [Methylobacter sp.]|nr:MAG: hypothetical protein CTY16_08005 [Methylobacter sp.]